MYIENTSTLAILQIHIEYRKVFSGLIYTALLVSAIWKRKFITDSVSMRFSDTNGTMEKPFLKKRSRYCLLPKYFCYKPFYILHRFPLSLITVQFDQTITAIAFALHSRKPGYWIKRMSP